WSVYPAPIGGGHMLAFHRASRSGSWPAALMAATRPRSHSIRAGDAGVSSVRTVSAMAGGEGASVTVDAAPSPPPAPPLAPCVAPAGERVGIIGLPRAARAAFWPARCSRHDTCIERNAACAWSRSIGYAA